MEWRWQQWVWEWIWPLGRSGLILSLRDGAVRVRKTDNAAPSRRNCNNKSRTSDFHYSPKIF